MGLKQFSATIIRVSEQKGQRGLKIVRCAFYFNASLALLKPCRQRTCLTPHGRWAADQHIGAGAADARAEGGEGWIVRPAYPCHSCAPRMGPELSHATDRSTRRQCDHYLARLTTTHQSAFKAAHHRILQLLEPSSAEIGPERIVRTM